MTIAKTLQVTGGNDTAQQAGSGQQHQASVTNHPDQQSAQQRPDQATKARTACQQTKQTLGLLTRQHIGQHAPGERNGQQVEHRQPDIESSGAPQVVGLQRKHPGEQQQIARKKTVGPGEDMSTLHLGRQPTKQRQRDQGHHEGAGKQPLQVFHTTRYAHGFAHWAQHEVAAEQQEKQRKPGHHQRPLALADVEQTTFHRGHGVLAQANCATSCLLCAAVNNGPLPALSWSSWRSGRPVAGITVVTAG
ncbi:hypothetical protein D3C72_1090670 [compost metagenome]